MSRQNITDAASRPSSEKTRAALIAAGLRLFGENGFAATSTRQIAAAADANIGSIAYHFGGKEKLRDACASHIVETIRGVARPALDAPLPANPAEAEFQLDMMLERMAGFMLSGPEIAGFIQFILREVHHPTAALDIIYDGLFEPVHRRFCEVWAAATGEEPESETVKIDVFTMIGQIVYFRIGREAVLRRMGWDGLGAAEAGKIVAAARKNMTAAIAARRGDQP